MTEILNGFIERVTYHNPENGFAVLRVKVRGRDELISVGQLSGFAWQVSVAWWELAGRVAVRLCPLLFQAHAARASLFARSFCSASAIHFDACRTTFKSATSFREKKFAV